jgi:hypothetical protein
MWFSFNMTYTGIGLDQPWSADSRLRTIDNKNPVLLFGLRTPEQFRTMIRHFRDSYFCGSIVFWFTPDLIRMFDKSKLTSSLYLGWKTLF